MKRFKNKIFNKKNSSLIILIILSITLLILARLLASPQETREQAAGSARLFFNPTTSQSSPLQKNINDTFMLELTLDPANSLVSFVKFEITYDQSKFNLNSASDVQINSVSFPVTFEEVQILNGKIEGSVSIGSDPTKAITTTTKVAQINFKAVNNTGGPLPITIENTSLALSIGSEASATENVLGSLLPAYIQVGPINGTIFPTSTIGPSITRAPTGSGGPERTTLTMNLLFHGLGSAGDSKSKASDLSNKNPIHQERMLNIQIVNEDNQLVATKLVPAFYNSTTGHYDSHVVINDPIPDGDYIVKVKTDPYLRKLMPGFLTVKEGEKNKMQPTELVTGDINSDNAINVLDYNILYDCGYGALNPLPMINNKSRFNSSSCMSHEKRENADLNDNGTIQAADYNLFIREVSAGFGQ